MTIHLNVNSLVQQYLLLAFERNKCVTDKYSAKHQYDILWTYYSQFQKKFQIVTEIHLQKSALLMVNYLATWGMYRGSSKLPNTNTEFMEHILKLLLNKNNGLLIPLLDVRFEHINVEHAEKIDFLLDKLRSEIQTEISATDTLISKILLGIWGQVPAYDRYFKKGIDIVNDNCHHGSKIPKKLSANSLLSLSKWSNSHEWHTFYSYDQKFEYTRAKLVDMALFELGASKIST